MHPRVQWAIAKARSAVLLSKFDESEPRDEGGQWTDGGGDSSGGTGSSSDSGGSVSAKEKDQLHLFGSAEASWKDHKAYDELRSSKSFGETLAKLPKKDGTFYRGMVLSTKSEVDQFKLGNTITLAKHSFASPQRDYAKAYTMLQTTLAKKGSTPIVMSIKNATAVDFGSSGYAPNSSKLEVVLPIGDKIKITSMKDAVFNGVKGFNIVAEYVK